LSAGAYAGVTGGLSSTNTYLTLNATNATFGTIPAGGMASNAYTQLYLSLASSTPTATLLPLSLAMRDSSGNTQRLDFALFCTPQLDSASVSPQICVPGTNVTITASFRGANYALDETGIDSVTARVQGASGGPVYVLALSNSPSTTGYFSSTWTIPTTNDWNVSLLVNTTQGNTGTYNSVSGGGFSSISYAGSANVLCYGDDPGGSYGSYLDNVAGAIGSSGRTCFLWKSRFRGNLTTAVLAAQNSKLLVYYAPNYPVLYYDSTLRGAVNAFINGGGRVCLAGPVMAYAMHTYGGTESIAFMSNRFGTAWVKQFYTYSGGTFTNIAGLAGDPVGSNLLFNLHNYSYYRDEIQAVGNGVECLRYTPTGAMGGATLGASGTAGTRIEGTNRTVFLPWDLGSSYLAAADRNRIVANVLNYLSSTGPLVSVQLIGLQDHDGDGCPIPGEEVWLTCQLRNDGSTASNVQATLTTTSTLCSVTQGVWAPGTVAAAASVSNAVSPYRIRVTEGAPLGTAIPLILNITANGGAYSNKCNVSVMVARPEWAVLGVLASDGGNHDGAVDPGERIHLSVCLTNSGYMAGNVMGRLSSSNAHVTMVVSNVAFGTMGRGACTRNGGSPFCFDVSPSATSNAPYAFSIAVSCDGGATSSLPVTLAVDYSVQPVPAYAWVDTTGGTTVTLGDEQLAGPINLGFSFPYYGQSFTTAYIDDNGYVQLGTPFYQMTYNNVPIPDGVAPNGIIAPFWDDLDTGTGIVRYKQFGSAPNRYWAAEWNAVPRYFSETDVMTFEVILHESGVIKFQYGALSGVNSDGRSATIGIESPTGSNGVPYAYNQAGAVTNGQVIVFGPASGSVDTDDDGLLDACEQFYFGHLGESGDGDADHDGMWNGDEVYCGTDPNDASNVLHLAEGTARTAQGTLILQWHSIPGQRYNVRWCTNLVTHAWTNANPTPLVGSAGGVNAYTTAPSATWPTFWNVAVP
jgi:hypothetical protein